MEKIWLKNYPDSMPADIDLSEYSSLADLLRRSTDRYAEQIGFVSFGHAFSYTQLERLSRNMAAYFTNELGLKQGDRVGLMLPNILQYPVTFFAAIRAGLVIVNLDPLSTQSELRYQLADSGCRAIVIIEDCARKLSRVIDQTPLEFVITTQFADLLGNAKRAAYNFQHKWLSGRVPTYSLEAPISFTRAIRSGLASQHTPYGDPIIYQNDLALIQYTSGTEGIPKGVMLSHKNLLANVIQASAWASVDLVAGEETVVSALPFCHIFGLTANLLLPLKLGAKNLLVADGRDCGSIVELLQQHAFSVMVGVSTLFHELLKTPGFSALDFSHLKLSLVGGMALHKSLARDWSQVTGVPIVECYGMTEASPAITTNPLNLLQYNGFIGLPLPSTEISIRDLRGNPLPPETPGELWVRGPQVMLGYWRKPGDSISTDGWFKTGDVAIMKQSGFIKLIERIRDIINVSGFVVYPSEIEAVVKQHPAVNDVGAIGIPDEHSGNAVKLFVVSDAGIDEAELLAHCKSNLSAYKCPKQVVFVERIPRQKSGRLLRRELRKAACASV
ncbi:MAG: AMP-binding protein [Leucothrix sp.]